MRVFSSKSAFFSAIVVPATAAFSLVSSGCMIGAPRPPDLAPRAAFDLNCPVESVEIVEIDSTARGATGCGARARYRKECRGLRCDWLLDAQSASAAPAAEASAPPEP